MLSSSMKGGEKQSTDLFGMISEVIRKKRLANPQQSRFDFPFFVFVFAFTFCFLVCSFVRLFVCLFAVYDLKFLAI